MSPQTLHLCWSLTRYAALLGFVFIMIESYTGGTFHTELAVLTVVATIVWYVSGFLLWERGDA